MTLLKKDMNTLQRSTTKLRFNPNYLLRFRCHHIHLDEYYKEKPNKTTVFLKKNPQFLFHVENKSPKIKSLLPHKSQIFDYPFAIPQLSPNLYAVKLKCLNNNS